MDLYRRELLAILKAIRAHLKGEPLSGEDRVGPLFFLYRIVRDCMKCRLSEGRTNLVFGEGNPYASILFIGEAPGREEDLQGRPFVGRAGKILTQIIESIGLTREEVYIANMVKCRPPGNRDPKEDEIASCRPYLDRQILIVQPKIICTLGRYSTQSILDTREGITRLRGKVYQMGSYRVIPTLHPSSLLRNPSLKKVVREDLKLLREAYERLQN